MVRSAGRCDRSKRCSPGAGGSAGVVERTLEARWSPQQISGWLAEQYPDDPEMRVSHETIYQSLFVQSRGALRKELHARLRTGRAMRRAKAYTKRGVGQGQLRDMEMISERPAEVADREADHDVAHPAAPFDYVGSRQGDD